ncbi:hypothetical protein [Gordonia alkanivorans]|uniref:hypothetical protein n=1 Tax=Gordonia alkanivorans TaxID=84096 RepID=UPI0012DE579C|nr:hypothetical protein [Gordonia alkanivorans]
MTTLAASCVLGLVNTSPAAADTDDPAAVTVAASSVGATVTVTINNASGRELLCGFYGKTPGTNPLVTGVAFAEGMGDVFAGGEDGSPDFFTVTPGASPRQFRNVPPGAYDVEWGCHAKSGPGTSWGTPEAMSTGATTGPTRVEVADTNPIFGSLS